MEEERTTSSKKFKYLCNYMMPGLWVWVENDGPGQAEIEVREIFDNRYKLRPGKQEKHFVFPYAEVWIRSISGDKVTVRSNGIETPHLDPPPEYPKSTKKLIKESIAAQRKLRVKLEKAAAKQK
jgi:hypothetical protein